MRIDARIRNVALLPAIAISASSAMLACSDGGSSTSSGSPSGSGGSGGSGTGGMGTGGTATCGPNATLCDGTCTVLGFDPANCGACGNACGAEPEKVNPGAIEVVGNGIDDNCNSKTDLFDLEDTVSCDDALASDSANPVDYAKALGICRSTTENPPKARRTWGLISAQLLRADGTALGDMRAGPKANKGRISHLTRLRRLASPKPICALARIQNAFFVSAWSSTLIAFDVP